MASDINKNGKNGTREPGGKRAAGKRAVARSKRIIRFFREELWVTDVSKAGKWKARAILLGRLATIAWNGIIQNNLLSRAAALSYGSLLALGPLVAIAVFTSSSFLDTDAETQIKRALLFIAPTLQEYVNLEEVPETAEDGVKPLSAIDELIRQIVEGANMIVKGIDTSGSGTFGVIGGITLAYIAIQLLTAIETTFNLIWGVREGRPWGQRIISYWTLITLGTILGFGSTALFSASAIARMFEWVPMHAELTSTLLKLSPLLSLVMLVALLTFVYSFFPNTTVRIRAALIGAVIVAVLLFLNNYLSILYVHRVLRIQNLYGSVGIIPVLMVGIFFFWVFVLLGGQLTYSIQNLHYLAFQHAWSRMSFRSRESIALVALARICRRFVRCEPPLSSTELTNETNLPVNLLNESLSLLQDVGWISTSHDKSREGGGEEVTYQPARPLETMTLGAFRRVVGETGEDINLQRLRMQNRVLNVYLERESELIHKNMDDVSIIDLLDLDLQAAACGAEVRNPKQAEPA